MTWCLLLVDLHFTSPFSMPQPRQPTVRGAHNLRTTSGQPPDNVLITFGQLLYAKCADTIHNALAHATAPRALFRFLSSFSLASGGKATLAL